MDEDFVSRDAWAVREFTLGSGQPSPASPEPMTPAEVEFVSKMILDEVMELMATVHAPEAAKAKLKGFIDESKDIAQLVYDEASEPGVAAKIADQADALVDACALAGSVIIEGASHARASYSYYYSLNAAAKKGVNLSSLFSVVHAANMAKRDPATGKFLKREDGKIIKPPGWQPPNVEGEIRRQMRHGAWTAAVPGGSKENDA